MAKRKSLVISDISLDIVNTIRESLLILDPELKVLYANDSFYKKFKVNPKETENTLIYNLGHGQWDISELKKLLEEILPTKKIIDAFEVRGDSAGNSS